MGLFDFFKKKSNSPKLSKNSGEYSVLNNDFKAKSKEDALNRYNYLVKEQKHVQSSLDRHEHIINESLDIIYKSKNLNTIKSRFDVICENIEHIKLYKKKGYQVNFDESFVDKLIDEYNRVIINLAELKFKEFEVKINSLKTDKAKLNQIQKINSVIDEISKSFKKPNATYKKEIDDIKNRIKYMQF